MWGCLFPRLMGNGRAVFPVGLLGSAPALTSSLTPSAPASLAFEVGVSTKGFPAIMISARMGGRTTAVDNDVSSDLFRLQSGNRSTVWKGYVCSGQTGNVLDFYKSFGL